MKNKKNSNPDEPSAEASVDPKNIQEPEAEKRTTSKTAEKRTKSKTGENSNTRSSSIRTTVSPKKRTRRISRRTRSRSSSSRRTRSRSSSLRRTRSRSSSLRRTRSRSSSLKKRTRRTSRRTESRTNTSSRKNRTSRSRIPKYLHMKDVPTTTLNSVRVSCFYLFFKI